jgi:hypothetical protein
MRNLLLSAFLFFTFSIINYGQSELALSNCDDILFGVTDSQDTDGDGIVCESFVTLQNSAMYSSDMICEEVNLNWIITIDVDNDGIDDLEYRSDLSISDSNLDDTNNNGIPDLYIAPTLNGEIQEIEIDNLQGPISTHSIVWKVSDDCDVEAVCEQIIKIVDQKSPIPYCVSLSTVIYGPFDAEGIEIFAEDFNVGAYDNCTPTEELRFSFSGDSIIPVKLITCDDVLNSPIEVDVYVWDNQDNVDFCIVYLQIIPEPTVDCYTNQFIEGYVKTEDNEPIRNAEVILHCNHVEFPQSKLTDSQGYYSFNTISDYIPGCYLTVERPGDYLEDVSTLDLVKIMRHILGLQPFTTPYQHIAADMNGNEKVSVTDLVLHRRLILGVISELPTNTSWRFIDKTFEFSTPNDPWPDLEAFGAEPYKVKIEPNLDVSYDFIGIKIGNIVN